MLQADNFVRLEGNLATDPEEPTDNILTFRIAVNNASYRDGARDAGFFDVKLFYNGVVPSHKDFLKRQLEAGNLKKGSRVSIMGSVLQETWKADDGTNRNRVVFVAHQVDYVRSGASKDEDAESSPKAASAELPDAF